MFSVLGPELETIVGESRRLWPRRRLLSRFCFNSFYSRVFLDRRLSLKRVEVTRLLNGRKVSRFHPVYTDCRLCSLIYDYKFYWRTHLEYTVERNNYNNNNNISDINNIINNNNNNTSVSNPDQISRSDPSGSSFFSDPDPWSGFSRILPRFSRIRRSGSGWIHFKI